MEKISHVLTELTHLHPCGPANLEFNSINRFAYVKWVSNLNLCMFLVVRSGKGGSEHEEGGLIIKTLAPMAFV